MPRSLIATSCLELVQRHILESCLTYSESSCEYCEFNVSLTDDSLYRLKVGHKEWSVFLKSNYEDLNASLTSNCALVLNF